MSDPLRPADRPADRKGHPIVFGVIALVGVTAIVGGALAGGVLAATRVLGVDNSATASDTTTKFETLIIPPLTASDLGNDEENYLTLRSEPSDSSSPTSTFTTSAATDKPSTAINLTAGETAVGPMDHLDLSGTYPQGGGAILQVERFDGTSWSSFPVTTQVHDDDTFSTYIQTGQTGATKFRMVDTDSQKKSNAVTVTIG